jgi:hypothetical protein
LLGIKIASVILSLNLCFAIELRSQNHESVTGFDRASFYKVIEAGDLEAVNKELHVLDGLIFLEKDAFVGALTMKKAGFPAPAGKKMNLFKAGHKKLENAIQKDTANAELRFLRLIIQEHAPGFLGYRKDIERDRSYIQKAYKRLPENVQQVILDYSKKSKTLKLVET